MKNFLTAVIPIRKGSQRVKGKNFKPFAKKNLLIHKIEILKKINNLDRIVVNTDSEEAISIARDMNVDHQRREDYYASSKCPNSEFWSHIGKTTDSKYIMFTNCTSPLIKYETYVNFINNFKKNIDEYDSFNTVTKIKEFLYLDNKPLNFDIKKTPNSQDLPDVVKFNFAINILECKKMYENMSLIGKKPFLYNLDEVEGFDINYPLEFDFAEYLFNNKHNS